MYIIAVIQHLSFLVSKSNRERFLQSNPLFDIEWYKKSLEIDGSDYEITQHFLNNSTLKNLNPSVLFDSNYYINQFHPNKRFGITLLEHFCIYGFRKLISPSPYFDLKYYCEEYEDVKISGINPLIHYLQYGWKENRNPNPFFESQWYLDQNPDVKLNDTNPLIHYIGTGADEGRNPSRFFDTRWYKQTYLKGSTVNPLGHFLTVGKKQGLQPKQNSNESSSLPSTNYKVLIEHLQAAQRKGPYFSERSQEFPDWTYNLKLIAFYLPQFHEIPENNDWWQPGFTEWTNVTKGIPRFVGHLQPRLPRDLGFYDLTDKNVLQKQIEIARQYGIFGFCFHYYWFSGKRLLERPLDIFLEETDLDFPFCICWANENWTRRWDGFDDDVLIKQDFIESDLEKFIPDLEKYIADRRYIKINDRPLLIVYRPQLIPNVKNVISRMTNQVEKLGFQTPIWVAVQAFGLENPQDVGFDVALEFPPHKLAQGVEPINHTREIIDDGFSGRIMDTLHIIKKSSYYSKITNYPLIKGVFPSWDNEARQKGAGTTFVNSSPQVFRNWLEECSNYALEKPIFNNSMVFINAWNEWAEGAYLEPDTIHGFAYLEMIKKVVSKYNLNKPFQPTKLFNLLWKNPLKILIISHDAHKHGAQLIILSFAKTLKRQFNIEISTLLLEGGSLEIEFREEGATFCIDKETSTNDDNINEFLLGLEMSGYSIAISNTTVSGSIFPMLNRFGFRVISLIHELPSLIKNFNLEENCQQIASLSEKVIFPANIVKGGFESFCDLPDSRSLILPQGVYSLDLDHLANIKSNVLREELKISKDDKVVLAVGYADLRKGFDIFLHTANRLISEHTNIHFVWIGNADSQSSHWIKHDLQHLSSSERIHIVSFKENIGPYMKDCDLYLLPSREDPFPTVVLEALAFGKPVIAFENAGGIPEINIHAPNTIELVPYLDIQRMAQATANLLFENAEKYVQYSENGPKLINKKFRYDEYCFDILNSVDLNLKKVSVIVPNYNYEPYLEDRLISIWNQDYPIFEVIVLDDCSTDESLRVINNLINKYKKSIRLFTNSKNSGGPFPQWKKGIDVARGEFIWIAEADDLSKPEFISRSLQVFQKDSQIGMVYCQSEQINENGLHLTPDYKYYTNDIDTIKWDNDYIEEGKKEIVSALSMKNTIMNVSSVLWKKERLVKTMDEEFDKIQHYSVAGDWHLYVKFLLENKIGFISESLNIHRRHQGSVTHALDKGRHISEIKNVHQIIKESISIDRKTESKMNEYVSNIFRVN